MIVSYQIIFLVLKIVVSPVREYLTLRKYRLEVFRGKRDNIINVLSDCSEKSMCTCVYTYYIYIYVIYMYTHIYMRMITQMKQNYFGSLKLYPNKKLSPHQNPPEFEFKVVE